MYLLYKTVERTARTSTLLVEPAELISDLRSRGPVLRATRRFQHNWKTTSPAARVSPFCSEPEQVCFLP